MNLQSLEKWFGPPHLKQVAVRGPPRGTNPPPYPPRGAPRPRPAPGTAPAPAGLGQER